MVVTQLKSYLTEVAASYTQLQQVLQKIIDLVIIDTDDQPLKHYEGYLATVTDIYEETRGQLVMSLAEVETQPVPAAREDDIEVSDEEGSAASGSKRTRSPPPKSCTDLKPPLLQKYFKPVQFAAWKRKLNVWFEASRFSKLHISCQQEYLRGCVAENLMALIEPDVAADSPVFPDEEWTEAVAIVDLLDTEITARNPIMSRRYGFFQSQMSRTQTFSQYLAHLRDIGNFCDLESLTPNGIVIFIAITTMCPEYEDLLDDVLKLDPSKLDLKTLIDMSRTFETSESTKKAFKKHAASTNRTQGSNWRGGGSGGGGAKGGKGISPSASDRAAQSRYENELRKLQRCMKCAALLSTEGHVLPCKLVSKTLACYNCGMNHLSSACHKNPANSPNKSKKSSKISTYKKKKNSPPPYTRHARAENASSSSEEEESAARRRQQCDSDSDTDDPPAGRSTAQTRCTLGDSGHF